MAKQFSSELSDSINKIADKHCANSFVDANTYWNEKIYNFNRRELAWFLDYVLSRMVGAPGHYLSAEDMVRAIDVHIYLDECERLRELQAEKEAPANPYTYVYDKEMLTSQGIFKKVDKECE